MNFFDHLEILRRHIIRSIIAIGIIAIAAFVYKDFIFTNIILAPQHPEFISNRLLCKLAEILSMPELCINQQALKLTNISMSGQFTTHIWVSFIAGIIIAFPYIFWEIWQFIKPALSDNAIKHTAGGITIVSSLFLCGIIFGYYLIAPMSIEFLGHYQITSEIDNQITLTSYISTITSIVLSSGIAFELPVIIWFFSKIGLISSSFLKRYRRHAILIIVILGAIITPPDIVSQIMVSIPMIALYEVGIVIARNIERKRTTH